MSKVQVFLLDMYTDTKTHIIEKSIQYPLHSEYKIVKNFDLNKSYCVCHNINLLHSVEYSDNNNNLCTTI